MTPTSRTAHVARTAAQIAAVALVAALLALLTWRVVRADASSSLVADIRDGKRPVAPAFTLPLLSRDQQERTLSLVSLRGRPVVLNFWASWCRPCAAEAPLLREAAARSRGSLSVVGINVQDFRGDALRFMEKHRINFPSVRDGDASTGDDYGLTGLPETYFLDDRGRITAHVIGELRAQTLAAGVASTRRSAFSPSP